MQTGPDRTTLLKYGPTDRTTRDLYAMISRYSMHGKTKWVNNLSLIKVFTDPS